jgi:hypothetical protein
VTFPAEPLILLSVPSAPKETVSDGPEPSSIPFFAFSLIEGYISIVMDAETQKKYGALGGGRETPTLSQPQGWRRQGARPRGQQGRNGGALPTATHLPSQVPQ